LVGMVWGGMWFVFFFIGLWFLLVWEWCCFRGEKGEYGGVLVNKKKKKKPAAPESLVEAWPVLCAHQSPPASFLALRRPSVSTGSSLTAEMLSCGTRARRRAATSTNRVVPGLAMVPSNGGERHPGPPLAATTPPPCSANLDAARKNANGEAGAAHDRMPRLVSCRCGPRSSPPPTLARVRLPAPPWPAPGRRHRSSVRHPARRAPRSFARRTANRLRRCSTRSRSSAIVVPGHVVASRPGGSAAPYMSVTNRPVAAAAEEPFALPGRARRPRPRSSPRIAPSNEFLLAQRVPRSRRGPRPNSACHRRQIWRPCRA